MQSRLMDSWVVIAGCLAILTPFKPSAAAGAEKGASQATTSYWYGGSLHPLVVTRDGVSYRLIGKEVVEEVGGGQPTRSYFRPIVWAPCAW